MKISIECSWKPLWRSLLQSLWAIPVGVLTSLAGYHWNSWQYWAFMTVCIVLNVVSNNSFHNEQMEKFQ